MLTRCVTHLTACMASPQSTWRWKLTDTGRPLLSSSDCENLDRRELPLKKGLPSPQALFPLPPRTWRSWRGEDGGQEWLEGDHSACRPPPLWKQLEKERSFQDPCRASLELSSPKSPCQRVPFHILNLPQNVRVCVRMCQGQGQHLNIHPLPG